MTTTITMTTIDVHDQDHDGATQHIRSFASAARPAHGDTVGAWLIEEERPVDWEVLSPLLGDVVQEYGSLLLRLKGVIWTADDPRPLVMHGVQKLFHRPVRLERWPSAPRTSIVAIGEAGAAVAARAVGRGAPP